MAKRQENYIVCSNCLILNVEKDMCIVARNQHYVYYCAKCEEETRGTHIHLGLIRGPKTKKSKSKK